MILINPNEVKIKENLVRFRKDLGDITELAKSIQRTQQILPIVITKDNFLIAGERRLEACKNLGIQVKAIYDDTTDDIKIRELELEENLHRKDFTPGERVLAVKELHMLKRKAFGETSNGVTGGWTLDDTAKILGKTRGSVISDLQLADMVETFPELKKVKTKSEIKKASKALEKLQKVIAGNRKIEEIKMESIKNGNISEYKPYEITKQDAIEHMRNIPTASIDILLTDPPYGIEINTISKNIGKDTGGQFQTSGFTFNDEKENALLLYEILAKESYRFTNNHAHAYVFVAPEFFWKIREIFITENWRVHVKPLIWIKRETGQCNVPTSWPSSCYEMVLFARKDNSRLVVEGRPDWIQHDIINPTDRTHQAEKPLPLLKSLLERVSLPGQVLYDPFMGSGSSLEAGLSLNLLVKGCDILEECYALTNVRLEKFQQNVKK